MTRISTSTIDRAHVRFALVAGIGFGCINGIGNAMSEMSDVGVNLTVGFVASVCLALFLVPLLALANNDALRHVPAWLLHVLAGVAASLIGVVLAFTAFPQLVLHLDPLPLRAYWVSVPPFATTGVLAALGYMQWMEGRRRASALHHVKLDRARVRRESYEAHLVALQARVEPGFLFDTLSTVRMLYDRDQAQGAKLLDDLIAHLRAALPTTDAASSSLIVELSLVRTWLDIACARSGGQLAFAMPHADAPPDARLPPMVLLPLVQHAVAARAADSSAIVVSAAFDGTRVTVKVIGPLAAFAEPRDSPDIAAARERFEALYAGSGKLSLQRVAYDRSQAMLDVPYEHSDRRPR